MLHKGTSVILIENFVSKDSTTSLKLSVLHNLIVNVVRVSRLFDLKFLKTLLALVNIDIAVLIINHVVHREDLLGCLLLQLSLLSSNFLLPECDLLVRIKRDLFQVLPLTLDRHVRCVKYLLINYLRNIYLTT